jgi:hypothetical protein
VAADIGAFRGTLIRHNRIERPFGKFDIGGLIKIQEGTKSEDDNRIALKEMKEIQVGSMTTFH